MYFDIYYLILVVPAFLFSLLAQFLVQNQFNKYSKIGNRNQWTGADVARMILDQNGLYEVKVEQQSGHLTDHYDPRSKVVRLSQSVYGSRSLAALGVAAHETGHAIQDKVRYTPLVLRSSLYPVAGFGSQFGPWIAIAGIFFSSGLLTNLGLLFFGIAVVFYLVTLPVEFNASNRAKKILQEERILAADEMGAVRGVLGAAAMTYVAAAAVAIASFLRLFLISRNRD